MPKVRSFADKAAGRENFEPQPPPRGAEVSAQTPRLLAISARQNPAENVGLGRTGGESGIRTHDTVSRIHAFQASAFSHSAIPPVGPSCEGTDRVFQGSDTCGRCLEGGAGAGRRL